MDAYVCRPQCGGPLACCFLFLLGLMALALFAFWLWMLIDAVRRCPGEDNLKLIWVLIIILVGPPLLGALLYAIIQRPRNPRPDAGKPPK